MPLRTAGLSVHGIGALLESNGRRSLMSFLQLVRREMEGSLGRLVFVSAMGGVSTTAIIGAINAGAGAADKGEISLWAAGIFRRRAAAVHPDAALHPDHDDRRDRRHHPQDARAADGLRPPLRAAAAGNDRPRRDRVRHHRRHRDPDAGEQHAGLRGAGRAADHAGDDLRRLSVVHRIRAERRHRRHRRRDLPFQDQAACRRRCAKRRDGKTGCTTG